jgi:hypothetical protein
VAFREQITLAIDVVSDKASGGLKKLSTDLKSADGAFAKAKVGASGLFDYLKQNAATVALAAGTALVTFAVKAVDAFQDTALGAGQLRDSLGVTADEASRFQEVAGDLGIGVEALETGIGRMNRAAEETPEAFDAIGAAIARNADGTVNVTETFLNTIDALNRIPDATKRAQAAQEIFGRGWQDMAELVQLGADGVRAAMDSVEEGKIIDDGEIDKAREFRDRLDDLKGTVEELSVALGGELVAAASDALGPLQQLIDLAEGSGDIGAGPITLGNALEHVQKQLTGGYVVDGINAINDAVANTPTVRLADDFDAAGIAVTAAASNIVGAVSEAGTASEDWADQARAAAVGLNEQEAAASALVGAVGEVSTENDDAARSSDELRDAARDAAGALLEQAAAALEVSGAFRSAADIGLDLQEAQQQVMVTAGDADATLIDLTKSVSRAADLERDLADANAEASGATLSHTQRLDTHNGSLLRQASQLQGPQRRAILDYIGQINGIPEERVSEIEAELNRGSVSNAEGVLNRTSRAREQTTTADARTGSAESALNYAARSRTATIFTRVVGGNVTKSGDTAQQQFGARARGGPVEAGEAYVVGEKRPELFVPDQDGMILPEVPGRGSSGLVTGASSEGARVVNVTINVANGDPNAIVQAIRKYERMNGPGWRAT